MTPRRGPRRRGQDREQVLTEQFRRLTDYLRNVESTNPFYADLWARSGLDVSTIGSLADYAARVPIVRKRDFLEDQESHGPFGHRLGVAREQLNGIHLTSGTTGIGQESYGLTTADQCVLGETLVSVWDTVGVKPGEVLMLTAPVTFLGAGLAGVASTFVGRYAPIYTFGLDKKLVLTMAVRFDASVFYAPPTLLLQLQRTAEAMGIDPRRDMPGLRGLVTSLFVPPFSLVQQAMDFWGVPVYDAYGCTQAGGVAAHSCAMSCWDGTRKYPTHFNELRYLFEVIDPDSGRHVKDGEEGELIVTPLWREASPVIRFGTQDRVVYAEAGSCPCGAPSAGIVPGETGRYDDMVKVKGINVWPPAVDDIVFAHPEVDEYRARVVMTEDGHEQLILCVALRPELDIPAHHRSAIHAAMERDVQERILIRPVMAEAHGLPHFDFKPRRWIDERDGAPEKLTWSATA